MPITQSANVAGTLNNQQPEYQIIWFPVAIDNANVTSTATPYPVGSLLNFNAAGVGATPGPGGDPAPATVGAPYTVPYVDLSSTTAANNPLYAGVLVGVPSLGSTWNQASITAASTYTLNYMVAMCALEGIMQVICDNTTSIGHTLNISTSTSGAAHDSGGSTVTAGTTVGVALQAVTITSGTALVWANVHRF